MSGGGFGVQGSGFRVHFRFLGTKTEQKKNKMKSEMSKNKKKQEKSKRKSQVKERKREKKKQSEHHPFDFGHLILISAN